MVADGFYEWQARNGKNQPYSIRLKSGQPFGIAGLRDRWDKQAGEPIESCTIPTTAANEPMMAIHERTSSWHAAPRDGKTAVELGE